MNFLGYCAPLISLQTLALWNDQTYISKYALPFFYPLTLDERKQLPQSVLKMIALQFEKSKNWKNLYQLSRYSPGIVLDVIFKANNHLAITDYVVTNVESMTIQEKTLLYKNLIISYKLELLPDDLINDLKRGILEADLVELNELADIADKQQCKICTERTISQYFTCLDAFKFNHGACKECYEEVLESETPACPWCRRPINRQ